MRACCVKYRPVLHWETEVLATPARSVYPITLIKIWGTVAPNRGQGSGGDLPLATRACRGYTTWVPMPCGIPRIDTKMRTSTHPTADKRSSEKAKVSNIPNGHRTADKQRCWSFRGADGTSRWSRPFVAGRCVLCAMLRARHTVRAGHSPGAELDQRSLAVLSEPKNSR